MAKTPNSLTDIVRFVVFSFLILFNVLLVGLVLKSNEADFRVFYSTGALIKEGNGSRIYQMDEQSRWQVPLSAGEPIPFFHLAYEGLLFVPFSLLSFKYALAAWIVLNIVFLTVSCVAFRMNWVVSFLFAPIAFTMALGQDSILLMALIAIALRLSSERFNGSAGFVLALALFRFHVVIPFVLLLGLVGRRRLMFTFSIASAVLLLISIMITGVSGFGEYLQMMLPVTGGKGFKNIVLTNMPTIRGLIELITKPFANQIDGRGLLIGVLWLVASAALIRKSLPAVRREPCLAIVVSLLVVPYGYAYELAPVGLLARDRLSWPLLILAFTPAYLALGAFSAVSLMALPLASLLLVQEKSPGLRLPSIRLNRLRIQSDAERRGAA